MYVVLSIMSLLAPCFNRVVWWEIIPGNLNSGHPTEKFIFQQLLPLEAEGREGKLHRGRSSIGSTTGKASGGR